MSTDYFLKIEGITGESSDSNHSGWIDVSSFYWGMAQSSKMASGGGGGAGKVQYKDLCVTADIDISTPAIAGYASSGKHIPKVEISACKAGGEQIEYYRITLEDVIITDVSYEGASMRPNVGVSYQFSAARVKQQYWQQTNKGTKGAEAQSGWNIKENKEI